MSIHHSTTFNKKLKHIFLRHSFEEKISFFSNWSPRMSYSKWQNLMNHFLSNVKSKNKGLHVVKKKQCSGSASIFKIIT